VLIDASATRRCLQHPIYRRHRFSITVIILFGPLPAHASKPRRHRASELHRHRVVDTCARVSRRTGRSRSVVGTPISSARYRTGQTSALSPWLNPNCSSSACAFGDVGAAQQDRQGGCASLAHLMRTGWFRRAHIKSESWLPAAAAADAPAQPEAEVLGSRERDPAFAEDLRHPHQRRRSRRLCAGGLRSGCRRRRWSLS